MAINFDEMSLRLEEDGAISMPGVVEGSAAIRLLDEAQARETSGDFRANMNLSETLPSYWECVAPLAPIAARLMRSREIRLYNDHLFIKKAGASVPTDWHQDLPFWPFSGTQIIAAWLALTPVRRTASAVHYLRGSHRNGKFYRPSEMVVTDARDPDFLSMEVCPNYFEETDAAGDLIGWDMEPGDVLWHNPLTVHGAEANRAENPMRAGLTVRFLGDNIIWDPKPYLSVTSKLPPIPKGSYIAKSDAFPLIWQTGEKLVSSPA